MVTVDGKEFLSRYEFIGVGINALITEIEGLDKLTAWARGETLGAIKALQREAYGEIQAYQRLKADIEAAVDDVADERLRTIFRLRYIECMTWADVADKMNYRLDYVQKIHKKGLPKIAVPDMYKEHVSNKTGDNV